MPMPLLTFAFDVTQQPYFSLTSTPVPFYPRVLRAVLYGAQIFVSFFLMLVFMTYNVGPLAHSPRLSADVPSGLFNPCCGAGG